MKYRHNKKVTDYGVLWAVLIGSLIGLLLGMAYAFLITTNVQRVEATPLRIGARVRNKFIVAHNYTHQITINGKYLQGTK